MEHMSVAAFSIHQKKTKPDHINALLLVEPKSYGWANER